MAITRVSAYKQMVKNPAPLLEETMGVTQVSEPKKLTDVFATCYNTTTGIPTSEEGKKAIDRAVNQFRQNGELPDFILQHCSAVAARG